MNRRCLLSNSLGLFLVLSCTRAMGQTEIAPGADEGLITAAGMFIAAPLVVLMAWLGRFLVIKRVRRLMHADSEHQKRDYVPGQGAREVLATQQPVFIELNAQSDLPDARARREILISRAQRVFGKSFVYELLIAAAYFAAGPIAEMLPPATDGAYMSRSTGDAQLIALVFMFVSLLRFIIFRQHFRAHQKGFFGGIRRLLRRLLVIASPKARVYLHMLVLAGALYAVITDWYAPYTFPLFLLATMGLHVLLVFTLRRSLHSTANLKITVLRKFGIKDNSRYTFRGLLKYWKLFGSFYTIVDPSMIRSKVKEQSRLLPLVIVMVLALSIAESELDMVKSDPEWFLLFVIFPFILLTTVGQIIFTLRRTRKDFVASEEDIDHRMARLDARPRKLDLSFRALPLLCYNNTWRPAVARFVAASHVVLMDLRGLASIGKGKGCQYEIDYLFDNKNIEDIVFLVRAPALPMVKEIILKQWEYLRTNSPNISLEAPKARIYVATTEDSADIQGILDVLFDAASDETIPLTET